MDRGSPQITLTNLAGDGSKLLERPITAVRRVSKGELTSEVASVDLALAPDGGYHLAFVDSRDGKADVYAARVNPRLAKTVAERRVSDTAGGAGEPRILAQGDRVLVVWSDTPPATAGSTPHGDLRAAVLRARDLVAQVPDKVLFASPAHSRTPNLSSFDGGVLVSWVEEADPSGPQGQGPDAAGARLLAIDGDAVPLASARLATLPGAPITSAAIACRPRHGCRLVVAAVGTQRTLHLAGLDLADPLSGPTQLRVKVLATLPHGTAQDVLLGAGDAAAGSAFFVEDAVGGRGARLRRLDVSW